MAAAAAVAAAAEGVVAAAPRGAAKAPGAAAAAAAAATPLSSVVVELGEEDLVTAVRRTCHEVLARGAAAGAEGTAEGAAVATVEEAGVRDFVARVLAPLPADKLVPPFALPLRFASVEDEVNLWMLLQLINFGSGFRHELHAGARRGAWETMVRGAIGLHLSGCRVTAEFMTGFDRGTVVEHFGFAPDTEVALMPGMYQLVPGPLAPLATLLVRVINDTGRTLLAAGHASFYSFLAAGAAPSGTRPSAVAFAQCLVTSFAGFRDVTHVRGLDVYVCKKAQLAAAYMARKFGAALPAVFDFHDLAKLTVMADNVVPAVLRAAGVLRLRPDVAAAVDGRRDLPAGQLDTELRAASIVACERIVAYAHEYAATAVAAAPAAPAAAPAAAAAAESATTAADAAPGTPATPATPAATTAPAASGTARSPAWLATLTEADLDEFLWTYGKKPDIRKLERHATKDTFFY